MKKQNPFTVYISGQIKNLDIDIATSIFKAAQIEWQLRGFRVINPLEIKETFEFAKKKENWTECVLIDIRYLMTRCDGIFMLNNWRRSRGARIERIIAQELGLFIAYQLK